MLRQRGFARENLAGAGTFCLSFHFNSRIGRAGRTAIGQRNSEVGMRKLACAGAIALAAAGAALINLPATARAAEPVSELRTDVALSDSEISRIKDKLNLTAEQERLWGPFAAALRDVARQRARHEQLARQAEAPAGAVQRAAQRAQAMAGGAVSYKRLASAAAPLIKSLDETQRRDALNMARAYGFEHLAAAF
jgi:hypothetical protein